MVFFVSLLRHWPESPQFPLPSKLFPRAFSSVHVTKLLLDTTTVQEICAMPREILSSCLDSHDIWEGFSLFLIVDILFFKNLVNIKRKITRWCIKHQHFSYFVFLCMRIYLNFLIWVQFLRKFSQMNSSWVVALRTKIQNSKQESNEMRNLAYMKNSRNEI